MYWKGKFVTGKNFNINAGLERLKSFLNLLKSNQISIATYDFPID